MTRLTLSKFSRGSSERVITLSSSPDTRWSLVGPDSEFESWSMSAVALAPSSLQQTTVNLTRAILHYLVHLLNDLHGAFNSTHSRMSIEQKKIPQ